MCMWVRFPHLVYELRETSVDESLHVCLPFLHFLFLSCSTRKDFSSLGSYIACTVYMLVSLPGHFYFSCVFKFTDALNDL